MDEYQNSRRQRNLQPLPNFTVAPELAQNTSHTGIHYGEKNFTLMKLLAASGRGILMELLFYAARVAGNKTHKILRQAQDQFD